MGKGKSIVYLIIWISYKASGSLKEEIMLQLLIIGGAKAAQKYAAFLCHSQTSHKTYKAVF